MFPNLDGIVIPIGLVILGNSFCSRDYRGDSVNMLPEHPTMEEDIHTRAMLDEEITKLQRARECILKTALDDETKTRMIHRIDEAIAKRL